MFSSSAVVAEAAADREALTMAVAVAVVAVAAALLTRQHPCRFLRAAFSL